jgi:predicted anti-sigma-YlaC factor YlaD
MNCERCDQWLQEVLDGIEPDVGTIEHLSCCIPCRDLYESAVALNRELRSERRPEPPEGLTDRIVSAVRLDRKRRQKRRQTWARVAVLAAAILVAWLVAVFRPQTRLEPMMPVVERIEPATPPSLREAVVSAGSAVVDRTRKEVGEAVESTLSLLPSLDDAVPPMEVESPLEPTTNSLRDAGQGVSSGLEPVAGSARRAIALFVRDLSPGPLKARSGL